MTAHRSGMETVFLGGEVGGNEGYDIRRDAVDESEGIPPLADGCHCD